MYPRKDDRSDRYGFWGRDDWAIRPQFAYANNFVNGYAAVDMVDGRSGLIATNGIFVSLEEICGGSRTPVRTDLSSPNSFIFTGFDHCDSQPSRYAKIYTENREQCKWGLIDTSLTYRPLPDEVFSGATDVKIYGEHVMIGRASDRLNESFNGLFNLGTMRLELPVEYSMIYPSRESIWVVSRGPAIRTDEDRSCFSFYDVSKREFLPGWFWEASPFSCGLGSIRSESGRSYFVDEDLRPAFDAEFDEVGRFSFGLAAVYEGEEAGYIDTTGQMRLLLSHYNRLQPFNEFGLAIANRNDAEWDMDIIDREGQPRLTGLGIAVFWEGDFPYFEVEKEDKAHFYDIDLNKIF